MEEDEPKYKIIFLETNKESLSSWNFTGHGKAFYINGDVYEGEYLEGLRHGKGIYTYKNKCVYEGDFFENFK